MPWHQNADDRPHIKYCNLPMEKHNQSKAIQEVCSQKAKMPTNGLILNTIISPWKNSVSEHTWHDETQHKARKRRPKVGYRANAILPLEKQRMWGTGYERTQHKHRKTTSSISCDINEWHPPGISKAIQVVWCRLKAKRPTTVRISNTYYYNLSPDDGKTA